MYLVRKIVAKFKRSNAVGKIHIKFETSYYSSIYSTSRVLSNFDLNVPSSFFISKWVFPNCYWSYELKSYQLCPEITTQFLVSISYFRNWALRTSIIFVSNNVVKSQNNWELMITFEKVLEVVRVLVITF